MEDKVYNYLWKMSLYINQNKLTLTDEKDSLSIMDQWVIEKCKMIINSYLKNIQDNDLDKAKKIIDNFFIDDFYKVYKIIVDNKIKDDNDYEMCTNVLLNVYLEIMKMYTLYYPEIIKFIYSNLFFNSKNLLNNDNLKEYLFDNSVLSFGEDVKGIILDIDKFRKDAKLLRKKAIDSVTLNIKKDDAKLFSKSLNDILKLINAKSVNVEFGDETYVDLITYDNIYVQKR